MLTKTIAFRCRNMSILVNMQEVLKVGAHSLFLTLFFPFFLLEKIFASIIIGHNPDGEAYLITPATSVRAGTEPPMVPVTDLSSSKS